jgi:hypothetical protein
LCLGSSAELQHFLCSLHVADNKTSVLLVDGFERFFVDPRCRELQGCALLSSWWWFSDVRDVLFCSHMGNVYQTLAFVLEAREYMKTATGSGHVVGAGSSDAFLLQNRPLLRRWCRFLAIVPDVEEPDMFLLREEVESAAGVSER